jgi:hypothetical protein
MRATGQSLDMAVGTGVGRPIRRDLRRHGCRGHLGVKGQKILEMTYIDSP